MHIPFCASRCDYCAFATWTDRHHLASQYVDAVLAEHLWARQHPSDPDGLPASPLPATLYLGGGTPSQLPPGELSRLLAHLELQAGAEVTLEANPEDVTPGLAAQAAAAGVNRVSLGVQSFDPVVLSSLGRRHDAGATARAVSALSDAGIASYNLDLIYGSPAETDVSFAATLASVLDLDPRPPHVSAYALTVEAGTPLAKDASRHPDDDVQARRYEMLDEVLRAAGYEWYEISNFALPKSSCRHNENYWAGGDYRGLGCAAHSHRSGRRWWNVRTPERYMAAVAARGSGRAVEEVLTAEERELESLELSLRTRRGVPAEALDDVAALEGLVEIVGDRAVLTRRGRLLGNDVACRLRAGRVGPRRSPSARPAPVRGL